MPRPGRSGRSLPPDHRGPQGIQGRADPDPRPPIANAVPHLHIRWDAQHRVTPAEMVKNLREGEPSIEVTPGSRNPLVIGVWMMQPGDDAIVGRRIREILAGA